ncbi:APC family permease [Ornithinimicrobium sp. INDO-MA30-4]|uniref:APC family permease n=1 Tax=Ornithinimicrobium sp. INDO-MA30-4 TaxID=2908651 RepID=UPI0021A44BD1|nr:APC family permease [Ornithinimicrobium sp. INDO-MA30-4]
MGLGDRLGSAVGWGAFVLPTDWLATAGPMGTILGLLIGAALMCLIAVSYGLLIRTFPVSGGEYAYTFTAFGRIHAFICGWFLTLGYTSIVALNASALALLFRRMVPWLVEWVPLWEIAGWQVYLGEVFVASLALIGFALLNTRGSSMSGRLQYAFCVVMLIAVGFIVAGVLLHPGTPCLTCRRPSRRKSRPYRPSWLSSPSRPGPTSASTTSRRQPKSSTSRQLRLSA